MANWTKRVASVGATDEIKHFADYVCDGVDDQVEIQAAIDSLTYYGRGVVCLSDGGFQLTAPVRLNYFVSLRGNGAQVTSLVLPPGANCDLLHVQGEPPAYVQQCSIEDMSFYGNESYYDPLNIVGSAIVLNYAQHCSIRNIYIARMPEWGIKVLRSYWCAVRDVFLYQCVNGVKIGDAGLPSNSNLLENVHIQNEMGGIGVHIAGGRANVFTKCDFSGCETGLRIENAEGCVCQSNQLYGQYFESNEYDVVQGGDATWDTFLEHPLFATCRKVWDTTGALYIDGVPEKRHKE